MPLQIKNGPVGAGVWQAAPASGKLAVRTGNAWRVVATAKIKDGPPGSGIWRDSGYVGLPGDTGSLSLVGWNYYDVHTVWAEPTTGAPVASYETQLLDSSGAVLQTQVPIEGGPHSIHRNDWIWRSLAPNGYYQMRSRSKSTTGLYSNWSPTLRVKMGQAEIYTPRSELRTRPWYDVRWNDDQGQDGWIVCGNGFLVTTHTIRIEVALANGSNPFCGTASRKASWIVDNSDFLGDVGYHNNPWTEDRGWGTSNEGWQGIVLRGNGWWPPSGWAGHGYVHLWGDQLYNYEWTEVTPAVPNSYW